MHWFKIHHGYNADQKLGLIAHKLNIPRAHINAIFLDLLEYASRQSDRGSIIGYDLEAASHALGLPEKEISDASLLLRDRHLITHEKITNWDKYQSPKDVTHAERQRRYREKQKQRLSDEVTDSDASRDTDKIREEKIRENKRRKESRGSRFALNQLPDDWLNFCRSERKDLDPQALFDSFRDYWVAMPGSRGVKLDWFATWRNWVRNQQQRKQNNATKSDIARQALFGGEEQPQAFAINLLPDAKRLR